MNSFLTRLDQLNEIIGRSVAWLAVAMVLVQFTVVVLRYAFGIGFIAVQESIIYMHGILFMAGAGYTLLHDEHVRVDIFYRDASPKRKAVTDILGTLFLLWPVSIVIWWMGWPYVALSWTIFEGGRQLSSIPAIFILKTFILIFPTLLALQGLSLLMRAAFRLTDRNDA